MLMRHLTLALLGGLAAAGATLAAGGPLWLAALLYVAGGNLALAGSVLLDLGLAAFDAWADRQAQGARNLRSDAAEVTLAPVRAHRG